MSTIIRRSPSARRGARRRGRTGLMLAGSGALVAGFLALAWVRGGPQPLREIAVPVSVPAAGAGR